MKLMSLTQAFREIVVTLFALLAESPAEVFQARALNLGRAIGHTKRKAVVHQP